MLSGRHSSESSKAQAWCTGSSFPQLHHFQRRNIPKICKHLRFCKYGRTERHAPSESVPRVLSTTEPVHKGLRDYGIIAKPLHNITKKGAKGHPPPWIRGTDYDLAFKMLKAIISDTKLYLHHKDKLKQLFLEVDASDVGWGACVY